MRIGALGIVAASAWVGLGLWACAPAAARPSEVPRPIAPATSSSAELPNVHASAPGATSGVDATSAPFYPEQEDSEAPEDEAEEPTLEPALPPVAQRRPHPLDGWSTSEIEKLLGKDPESLGSVTLGRPSAGALMNGVQMPRGEGWKLIDPKNAWGTTETVEYIRTAIEKVRKQYAGSHDVYIGHISSKHGGALRPHLSHQAGRDVDLSYFYNDDSARWYRRADQSNLDLERTWAFVRAFVTDTDVELILIDRSIQKLLREHALSRGEDPTWVSSLFGGDKTSGTRPLILHARGHATHLHVRFYNPVAQETARLAHSALAAKGLVTAATTFVLHRAKRGETLGMLARKYGTTVREIQLANGLRSTRIHEKKAYRVPKRSKLGPLGPVVIPPRRLPPPTPKSAAGREAPVAALSWCS